ncbi:LAGLIDADG family homing endonuclease [Candidatus Woesearchaeota archaeon]|nr:LAGLIDADG family homing endonuclease [Candidatus Woesearchaeota archaeon]
MQSSKFNEGFILGLALSDGYLKKKFILSTISKNLAAQLMGLLKQLKLTPKMYVHERKKYGWKDLFMVRLTNSESEILRVKLDEVITELGFKCTFDDLKYKWPRCDFRYVSKTSVLKSRTEGLMTSRSEQKRTS